MVPFHMDTRTHKTFSHDAWNKNARIYEIIRTMPFNAALAAGTLSEARFKHYIVQDAHYLIGFGRALALAGAKAPSPDRIVQFAKSAEGAIVVERALHGSFFQQYRISSQAFAQMPLSPACHHYVSYLLATAYAEPYEVLLGALLPCFWIYAEVGRDIHDRAATDNPYQAWIDTYSGEEFHNAVSAMIAATDEAAETASSSSRERMHAAFVRATQLEWMFSRPLGSRLGRSRESERCIRAAAEAHRFWKEVPVAAAPYELVPGDRTRCPIVLSGAATSTSC